MKMNKFWNFVKRSTDKNELMLYGPISQETWWGDEITPREFLNELEQCNGDLDVRINSGGGDVFAAQSIYTALCNYQGNITVYIDGLCASAATIIACAANKVVMPNNALYMIHNPAVGLCDHYDEIALSKVIKALAGVKKTIKNVYAKQCQGLSDDEISQLMDDETWLTAEEAKNYGFIHEIDAESDVEPVINKGMVFVNDISCKYDEKNAKKIETIINKQGDDTVENQNNKLMAQIMNILGLNQEDIAPKVTNDEAVLAERNRVNALDALKSDNVVINAIVEEAKRSGKTVEDITDFVKAVENVDNKPKESDAIQAITQLIQDQLSSGATNVVPTGKEVNEPENSVKVKQAAIDDIVNFANKLGGKK